MTLEGHWPLTEDSGSTAYDYSGNGNDGTINGAGPAGTGTVTGPFGNSAYDFDGSNDIIDCGFSDDYTRLTVSCWVNWDTVNENGYVVSRYDTSSNSSAVFLLRENGTIDWGINDGGGNEIISGPSASTGQWYHIVGTWNGTTLKLYVDGFERASSTNSNGPQASADNYTIGGSLNNEANVDGTISDVRIYSRALSPQEVQALYQAGVQSEVIFE